MDILLLDWERHSAAASAGVVLDLGSQTFRSDLWEGHRLWLL